MRGACFAVCVFFAVAFAQTYPDQGGAQITKPFQHKVTGAVCFTGTGKLAGTAFFNFPTQDKKVLAFDLGPAGVGQEKSKEFDGPGKYEDIMIFLQSPYGESLSGRGEVLVNDDERSGSFSFKTGSPKSDDDDDDDADAGTAAGTWDCGRKLTH